MDPHTQRSIVCAYFCKTFMKEYHFKPSHTYNKFLYDGKMKKNHRSEWKSPRCDGKWEVFTFVCVCLWPTYWERENRHSFLNLGNKMWVFAQTVDPSLGCCVWTLGTQWICTVTTLWKNKERECLFVFISTKNSKNRFSISVENRISGRNELVMCKSLNRTTEAIHLFSNWIHFHMKRKPAKNAQYISQTGEFAHIYYDSFGKEDAKSQLVKYVVA